MAVNHDMYSLKTVDDALGGLEQIHRLLDQGKSFVDIDTRRLIHDMITLAYERSPACISSSWFASTHDLPAMVYNFVQTRDCFFQAFPCSCIEIRFSRTDDDPGLHLIGDVAWQPPWVDFWDLVVSLTPGEEYHITPQYISPDLDKGRYFRSFREEHEFLVSSLALPLKWDADQRRFRVLVPKRAASPESLKSDECAVRLANVALDTGKPDHKAKRVETTFSVKISKRFPGNVCHERITRYNLKLDIAELKQAPKLDHNSVSSPVASPRPSRTREFSYSNTPLSKCGNTKQSHMRSYIEPLAQQQPRSLNSPSRCKTPDLQRDVHQKRTAIKRSISSHMLDRISRFEGSQLALDQFEHVDLESPKRQKMDKNSLVDGNRSTAVPIVDTVEHDIDEEWLKSMGGLRDSATRWSGKALAGSPPKLVRSTWRKKLWELDQDLGKAGEATVGPSWPKFQVKVRQPMRKKGIVRRTAVKQVKRSDTPVEYPSPKNSSPPSPQQYPYRTQFIIAKNYKDFLEEKEEIAAAQRKSGRESTRSEDDERKAFEDIFLEDNHAEDWSTEADGLSSGLSSLLVLDGEEV